MMALSPFLESGDFLALPVWPEGTYLGTPMSHPEIVVPVSDAFWTAWHAYPGDTAPQIEMAIRTLVLVFMRLAVIGQGVAVSHVKSSPDDIVTEVDTGLEGLFRMWLSRHFPEDRIVGEEGSYVGMAMSPSSTVWIIDPIDGTSNYAAGSPDVVIQVCRLKDGIPDVAVMGFPFYDLIETGSRGGVILPNQLWSGPMPETQQLCMATEYRDDRIEESQVFLALSRDFDAMAYRIKSIGVNVYSLSMHDAFVFYKPRIKVWDIYPPLALLYLRHVPISSVLYVSDGAAKGGDWIDPFSDRAYAHLWASLARDGRIGHIVVMPIGFEKKEQAVVLKERLSCMSLFS
jgi:fructose-1,6-bisphosphatase/inositol monophosphatase family enzyme